MGGGRWVVGADTRGGVLLFHGEPKDDGWRSYDRYCILLVVLFCY